MDSRTTEGVPSTGALTELRSAVADATAAAKLLVGPMARDLDSLNHTVEVGEALQETLEDPSRASALAAKPAQVEALTNAWRGTGDAIAQASRSRGEGLGRAAWTSVMASTATTSAIAFEYSTLTKVPAAVRLENALVRPDRTEDVIALIARLGIRPQPGEQDPQVLLREALAALTMHSGHVSVVACLIPLRSAIDVVIQSLLRRRPRQERAKNWRDKVWSILAQCGLASLDVDGIRWLTQELERLLDQFSAAKTSAVTTDRLRLLYSAGVGFLYTFLGAIDRAKLKPNAAGGADKP